ncbi:phenylacetate--CoA ligase family protein [Roseateles saccharophilus]|uniref:Phenylacetate-CoA ligase n=1 Tax=Roseateles saccharophilus TaxID=304 RepID=A0A4R3UEH4_ROSSA|nr:AMP-binding protein [Roseateles saccharophilus]MDG0835632.1 phenylacetate--CoA ligase family protein [Roseateles saccharophilus]TCU85672.1 phenylacetate-CoA ligase [Roseateles saccharophilus]
MSDFFDPLETRDPAAREAALMAALPAQIAHAQASSTAYTELLAGVDAAAVSSRAALARLPLTRKSSLSAAQAARRTLRLGGYAAGMPRRIFQSPGPLYEPEPDADGADPWRIARALHAAGIRAGQLAHVGFSYHLTPAGAMMEAGLRALGAASFPGGVGNTELQLRALLDLQPEAYAGTPSLLRILLEKAADAGQALSLRRALVSGEACPPALVAWFAERGVQACQCYATADLGLIAYQTEAREGLVVDEGVIVEIVRPGSGEPLPEGEVGEVVVTTLSPGYPLIRFATGDLSAVLPGASPCGRSNQRLRGWLGRADQSAKVRGMFVHAGQLAELLKRHAELRRVRLVVDGEMADDRMTLLAEVEGAPQGLDAAVAATLRELTKLRGEVSLVAPGSLPNDGRVIEDRRSV